MADTKPKPIFDMEPDAAHEARLDAEAMADYEAGRFVPQRLSLNDGGTGVGWPR
jgi:hypothetical protein